jgi:hypothetical protein
MSESKLLHQLVVMVGELFQHGEALRLLEVRHVLRHVDELAFQMLLVDEGALQRQIHEARHDRALHDRQLPQDQRLRGGGLQPGEHVARRGIGLVHLVDEEDARQPDLVELLQDQLQGGGLLVVGLADDDGDIAPISAARCSCANSMEPGQSRKV